MIPVGRKRLPIDDRIYLPFQRKMIDLDILEADLDSLLILEMPAKRGLQSVNSDNRFRKRRADVGDTRMIKFEDSGKMLIIDRLLNFVNKLLDFVVSHSTSNNIDIRNLSTKPSNISDNLAACVNSMSI